MACGKLPDETDYVRSGRGSVDGQGPGHPRFVISRADRVVNIAGIITRPDEPWMLQIGRNLTDAQSGALDAKRYLIDRDSKYSERFRR
jgi:hypothetical protein